MARQTFEDDRTRAAEDAVADRLAAVWGYTYKRLPYSYGLDFVFFQGGIARGLVEVKVRPGVRAYPDFRISLRKIVDGRALAQAAGLGIQLVIDAGDGLYRLDATRPFAGLGWIERRNPRDPWDGELAAIFPWDTFTLVKERQAA